MGHHLTAFLGRAEVLRHLPVPRLRLAALPQGLSLAPMPEDLVRELIGERDMLPDELLDELAKVASKAGTIGWLMSDWFGSNGSTDVGIFREGRRLPGSQSELFAALGVVRVVPEVEGSRLYRFLFRLGGGTVRPLDEWDSLGLGYWRNTERAYALAKPVETLSRPSG